MMAELSYQANSSSEQKLRILTRKDGFFKCKSSSICFAVYRQRVSIRQCDSLKAHHRTSMIEKDTGTHTTDATEMESALLFA